MTLNVINIRVLSLFQCGDPSEKYESILIEHVREFLNVDSNVRYCLGSALFEKA